MHVRVCCGAGEFLTTKQSSDTRQISYSSVLTVSIQRQRDVELSPRPTALTVQDYFLFETHPSMQTPLHGNALLPGNPQESPFNFQLSAETPPQISHYFNLSPSPKLATPYSAFL